MAGRGWEQAPGRPSSCFTDREAFFLLHRPSWQTFFVFCNDGRSQPHWCVLPRFFTSFWVSFTLSLFPSREVALSHYQILHRLLDLTGCSYGPACSCPSALFYAVSFIGTCGNSSKQDAAWIIYSSDFGIPQIPSLNLAPGS